MELSFGSSESSNEENPSVTEFDTATVSEDLPKEIDITIHNVCVCFSVGCSLNLNHVARTSFNVEHQVGANVLIMRLRKPRCTARIFSSGKVTLVGASSEEDAKIGARRCARVIQKLGFKVRFMDYRIVNVLGTCTLPFAVRIGEFSVAHQKLCSYEPLIHSACTLKLDEWKASLQIYYIGKMSVLAPCVANIQLAVEEAYELLIEFKKERRIEDILKIQQQELTKLQKNQNTGLKNKRQRSQPKWTSSDRNVEEEPEGKCKDDEFENIPSNVADNEESDSGVDEILKLKPVTKKILKIMRKKRKTRKKKWGTGTSTDENDETEDDFDDEEYVPQKKKIRRGLGNTPTSSPKQGYVLRKTIRKSYSEIRAA